MRGATFAFGDLRGGLNTRDSAYEVKANQARDLLNVTGSSNGAVRKRDGAIQFAALPNPASGAIVADAVVNPKILLADLVAGRFRSVATDGTPSALTSGSGVTVSPGFPWAFAQAPTFSGQGPVFGCNADDPPVQWDGGSTVHQWTSVTGTLPNGKLVAFAGGRLFVAGMSSYPAAGDPASTLVWSDIYNPGAWPSTNFVQLDPNDGDVITGLGTIGPYLLVFKRNKVYVIYDLATGANRRLASNTGCVAPKSIVETPVGTFFLSDRGVYLTNGQKLELVSDIITPTIQGIQPSVIADSAGGFFDNHYLLSVSDSGSANNILLDYDLQLQSWWKHSHGMSQLLPWRPSSSLNLYGTDAATGRISRLFTPGISSDYGAAFVAQWTGAWLAPRGPVNRHRLRQVRADISGHLALCIARDFKGAPTLVRDYNFIEDDTGDTFGGADSFGGDGTFGDPNVVAQAVAPTPANNVARAFSLQWASQHTDPWQLEAFEMLTSERRN